MNEPRQIAQHGLDALLKAGADKAQCSVSLAEKHEMNVDSGEMSLLRTTYDIRVGLTALKDNKRGSTVINKSGGEVDDAARDVLQIASASKPDEANDIAEAASPAEFSAGTEAPDLSGMHSRLREFLDDVKVRHPKAVIRQAYLDFTRTRNSFVNSNGVDFQSSLGVYRFSVIFSSKDGDNVSSFNYTSFAMPDLDKPLIEGGLLDTLLRQSGEQVVTRPIQGKFVGDVIFTPDCLGDLLGFLIRSISDGPVISGTSIYKSSLNEMVASPLLTVHANPTSKAICDGYFVTADGYAARDCTIIDKGILKSYLLSLYGSRKTGKERAANDGGGWVIDAGTTSYEDMVKSVKKGILMARFSGGNPSNNGDFSGVAKNSYLIEDGEIKYPVSETMVSGNLADMLKNISAVSKERVNFGDGIAPWILVRRVTISGK